MDHDAAVDESPGDESSTRFPLLFQPQRWDWASVTVQFQVEPVPDELIQSIHVVGFTALPTALGTPERGEPGAGHPGVVCCRDGRDVWFLPGGTREPDEPVEDCVRRELAEEAGAALAGPLRWLGAHVGTSERAAPYRPHLPHPTKAWVWYAADVVLAGTPSNPPDGEQVLEVRAAPRAEARRLLRTDESWMPDLVDLAYQTR